MFVGGFGKTEMWWRWWRWWLKTLPYDDVRVACICMHSHIMFFPRCIVASWLFFFFLPPDDEKRILWLIHRKEAVHSFSFSNDLLRYFGSPKMYVYSLSSVNILSQRIPPKNKSAQRPGLPSCCLLYMRCSVGTRATYPNGWM